MPDAVAGAGLDPAAPAGGPATPVRWWGRHVAELRWQAELARLLADPVYRGRGVTRGDGMAVMLMPGFLAGDMSLSVMREWLERMRYRPYASGITVNVDCSDRALVRLEARLRGIHSATGRPVALLGHSRGAHFAKALAHWRPELTAGVISLGAGLDKPFDISVPTKTAVAAVRAVHGRLGAGRSGCLTDACDCGFAQHYSGEFPAQVPLTSIYSREDGVVRWEACVVPYARNVELTGSHIGLAFNRKAYVAIGEALAAMTAARAAAAA